MPAVELLVKTTLTAAGNGAALDIDTGMAATDEFSVEVEVSNLIGVAQIELQDSVDAFTAHIVRKVWTLNGAGEHTDLDVANYRNLHTLRIGTASAVARIAVTELTGAGKTITLRADLKRNV